MLRCVTLATTAALAAACAPVHLPDKSPATPAAADIGADASVTADSGSVPADADQGGTPLVADLASESLTAGSSPVDLPTGGDPLPASAPGIGSDPATVPARLSPSGTGSPPTVLGGGAALPGPTGSAENTDAAGSEVVPAVWCPPVVPTTDPAWPTAGAVTLRLVVPTAAGRTLTWAVSGTAQTGSVTLDATGSASIPSQLATGAQTVTTTLAFADGQGITGWCPTLTTSLQVAAPARWASGVSGAGVVDGSFATWRASPVPIAGTWSDNNEAMIGLWQLRSGGEYAGWGGDLDLAVGAIGAGETWAAAATGAYDARWRQSLVTLRQLWSGHPGRLYLRFAHEFNGDWYPWSVTASSVADFRSSWLRYRALQQEIFPQARLVFSVNSDTATAAGFDWRTAFPGAASVDVLAVDYYNMYPWTNTVADFQALSRQYDRWGAPRGLQRHQEFAQLVGLPFAVSEWGNNAAFGDAPVFVQQMHAFFAAHSGTGAGQLAYEVYFNVIKDDDQWVLNPVTRAPQAAAAYRDLF